jgi:hypothetical protein
MYGGGTRQPDDQADVGGLGQPPTGTGAQPAQQGATAGRVPEPAIQVDTLAALATLVGVDAAELARTPAGELEELFRVFGVPVVGKVRIRAEVGAWQARATPQTQSIVSAEAMQMALDMDLMDAACKDDVASVERLVAHGANPNTTDNIHKQPVLTRSAYHGCAKAVSTLVRLGADIDAVTSVRPSEGFTALSIAARNGQVECVRALLASGADTTIRNKFTGFESGKTALECAEYCLDLEEQQLSRDGARFSADTVSELSERIARLREVVALLRK